MKNPDFHFHATADGSPTLSMGSEGEWMHHRQGAFSETVYVYGEAVARIEPGPSASFVSVGLGLGYVETLLAARAVANRMQDRFVIRSFEANPVLRENFLAGLVGKAPDKFGLAYSQITQRFAVAAGVSAEQITDCLIQWERSGRWVVEGAIRWDTPWARRYDAILYDAYSSETSAELWTAEFLDVLLSAATQPRCLLATYACTGTLKRALAKHGFVREPRVGFSGKRECTLAVRS